MGEIVLNSRMKRAIDVVEKKVRDGVYIFEEVPCLCGGDDFEQLCDRDRYGMRYYVARCLGCGLMQANPRMTAESYRQFYEQDYRKIYNAQPTPASHFLFLGRKGMRIVDFVSQYKSITPKTKVLEIGCSNGGILFTFKRLTKNVVGYDYNGEYIAFGKKRGLDLRKGNVFDVNGVYDVIVYSHVLEHILDPRKELERVKTLLAPGGVLYIDVPDTDVHIQQGVLETFTYQNAHVYHFTKPHLFRLMDGYEMIAESSHSERNMQSLWKSR